MVVVVGLNRRGCSKLLACRELKAKRKRWGGVSAVALSTYFITGTI